MEYVVLCYGMEEVSFFNSSLKYTVTKPKIDYYVIFQNCVFLGVIQF